MITMGDQNSPMMKAMKRPRSVQFTQIEIIELPYTLGDNPSVSGGPPISASWTSQKRTVLDLEFFEQYRPPRRNKSALHLSKEARKELMLQNGHSEKEIQLATIQAGKTRKQRIETIQELKEKIKSIMSANARKVQPLSNMDVMHPQTSPSPISSLVVSSPVPHHLPPSPIIPRKSPARSLPRNHDLLPHLRFPGMGNSVLSPRGVIRKRTVPIDLGNDLLPSVDEETEEDVLTPHIYSSTPKRLCSPRNTDRHHPPTGSFSPPNQNFCASMRFPARVRSPKADSRPLIKPRRLASPQPLVMSHQSPPPRSS